MKEFHEITGRRQGKSHFQHMAKEAALDAGMTVVVVGRDSVTGQLSVTRQRRKKHLTMIETLPEQTNSISLLDVF